MLGSSIYPILVCRASLDTYISISQGYDEQSRQHRATELTDEHDQFHFFLMWLLPITELNIVHDQTALISFKNHPA